MRRTVMILTVALAACSDASSPMGDGGPGGHGGDGQSQNECPLAGATECVDGLVRECIEEAGLVWSELSSCPGEQSCRDGACADPTAAQLAQADAAEGYLQTLLDQSGWHGPLDAEALANDARAIIVHGDGSDLTFKTALRSIHLGHPQGHQGLYDETCGLDMPQQDRSRLGVCGRPYQNAIVVTYAQAGNPLGLAVGDRVVAAGDDEGEALLEASARRPVCGASSPAASHRRTSAAASFFGTVPAGTELRVQRVGGVEEVLVVPAGGAFMSCQDPLGRDIAFNAQAYLRPDGVGVVRLPRFFPIDFPLPPNPTQQDYDNLIQHMQQAALDAFLEVADAPAIVWDARSNYGGVTTVGLAIVGGMPSAVSMPISSCRARIAGSNPPQFGTLAYAEYAVEAGGPFAYAGKVAVLIDGLDYSAADYFPYAVSRAAPDTLLVGSATAGAYGGQGPQFPIVGPPSLLGTVDPNRCAADDGTPLEGFAVAPDLEVEYDPDDLAAGVDTVLEAAVNALLTN